jgi:hypothetical protein
MTTSRIPTARTQKNLVRPNRPYLYRGYVLRTRADGTVDLVDPDTGRWFTNDTQRYARWKATFLSNIMAQFEACATTAPVSLEAAVLVEALTKDDYVTN